MGNEHFPQDSLMFIVHCSMITWANTTLAGGRGFYLRPRFSGYWSRQRPEGRGFSGRRDSTSGRTASHYAPTDRYGYRIRSCAERTRREVI